MATEVTCIVDTDGTQNQDYTSLAAAIAGETGASPKCVTSADLVANDQQLTIECRASSGAADGAAEVDGFTQDEDRYVEIYIPPAHRHNGKWSTGKYRIESTVQDILYIKDSYTRVRGIQVKGSSTDWYNRTVVIDAAADYVVFEDFIIINDCQRENMGQYAVGFKASGTSGGVDKHDLVRNGIIICKNYTRRGFYSYMWNAKLFNVTIYGGEYGIASWYSNLAVAQFTNIVAVGASVSCFYDESSGSGFSTSSDYNASDDGTAPGANSIDLTGVSLGTIFTDYSNEDFSLVSNSPPHRRRHRPRP